MIYKEAINKLINEHDSNILDNSFLSYSILSDYVGSSLYDKGLVNSFYVISKKYNIFIVLKSNGLSKGLKFFEEKYLEFKNVISKKEYVDTIKSIAEIICFSEETKKEVKNNESPALKGKIKNECYKPKINTVAKEMKTNLKRSNEIKVNCGVLRIIPFNKEKIEVYLNGKEMNTSKLFLNKEVLDLSQIVGIYQVYLPKNYCQNLKIIGDNSTIELNTENKILFEKIEVKCKRGVVNLSCDSKKMLINSEGSCINLFGKNENISIHDKRSIIKFKLSIADLDKTNIDIKSEQAVIKGDFVEGKIFSKICGMNYLKNREYVSGNYFVESCNVKINAFNMHGTIEIH